MPILTLASPLLVFVLVQAFSSWSDGSLACDARGVPRSPGFRPTTMPLT